MNPHLIYLTAIILFIVAIIMIFGLAILSLYKRKKSENLYSIPVEDISKPKVGVVEVPEKDQLNSGTNQKLRTVKDRVEQIERSIPNPLLIELWKSSIQFLEPLEIKKILLLQLMDENKIDIERYKGFYLDTITYIEDELKNKDSILKQLILQKKDLAFSGNLEKNKAFQYFFSENEKTKFSQVYMIPIYNDKKYYASIIFFAESNQQTLPSQALHEFIKNSRGKITEAF